MSTESMVMSAARSVCAVNSLGLFGNCARRVSSVCRISFSRCSGSCDIRSTFLRFEGAPPDKSDEPVMQGNFRLPPCGTRHFGVVAHPVGVEKFIDLAGAQHRQV